MSPAPSLSSSLRPCAGRRAGGAAGPSERPAAGEGVPECSWGGRTSTRASPRGEQSPHRPSWLLEETTSSILSGPRWWGGTWDPLGTRPVGLGDVSREVPAGLRHWAEGTTPLSASAPGDRRDGVGDPDAAPRPTGQDGDAAGAPGAGPRRVDGPGPHASPERRPPPPSTVWCFTGDGPLSPPIAAVSSPPAASLSFVPRPPRRLGRTHGGCDSRTQRKEERGLLSRPSGSWPVDNDGVGEMDGQFRLLSSTITHHCLLINRRVMLSLNVQQDDNGREVCNEVNHP
ncbi:hypothetical protein mRhiFer1_009556 [Rhinolophus ferrumequinum]|uniref:Uncharacterized protein n=1 Tax=Rhinolophus ferrumequinum TaxID=59479 RepID=A0A7J7ZQ28_RHIFE|nr:hypothetical protein mRhiFer1_009556 [Rhinolophus ferrumequinum]